MKTFYANCLMLLCSLHWSYGQVNQTSEQPIVATGTVTTSESNQPLAGVQVSVYRTDVSTITDSTGAFSIRLNAATDTIVFTLQGRVAKGVILPSGRTSVNVSLDPSEPSPASEPIASPPADNTNTADSSAVSPPAPADAVVQQSASDITQTSSPAQGADATSQRIVSGIVTSAEDKLPIPGVNVLIKNTSQGVVTDIDGRYTLGVNGDDDVLVFSFGGMQSKEVTVGRQSQLNVVLEAESRVLSEVVVVGYGTMDRATLTSAVSTIGSSALENDPLPSVTQAIQGKAGGVQVTQRGGSPGGGISIRVRGTTSINASSDPLYVVDGVPVNSTTNFTGGSDFNFGGGTQGINILSTINPSDIESVEVLKDAASSSIYGARAANGVVLITTKRGKANSSAITVNAYAGVSEVPRERRYQLLNTDEYVSYMQDYYTFKGTPAPEQVLRTDVETDWQDEIFRVAPIQNYELAASGGGERTRYYSSLGYFNQQGVIRNSGFDRISTRLNLDHEHSDRLKFSANITLARAVNNRVQEENSREGSTKNGIVTPPNLPVYDEAGNFAVDRVVLNRENPVALLELPINRAETFRLVSNVSAEYQILNGLTLRTNWGADMSYIDEQFFMPPTNIRFVASSRGLGGQRSSRDQLWLNENILSFDRTFGESRLNVLGGISFQESKFTFVDARRTNFATNDIPVITAGGVISGASATQQEWSIASYFSRINYGLKNKYIFTANFRIDGSSRFGVDNRYGTFPSFAAAWRISEEDFMDAVPAVNNLKLRASWGLTGNQNIPNYASFSLYNGGNAYLNQPGFLPGTLGDNELGWETTEQTNIGLDVGLFNDRISLLADYYVKNTSDLLISVQVPRSSGFTSALRNIGEIQNRGLEFELSTKNLTGDFRWNTSLNMTFNRNEVTSLPEGDLFGGLGGTLNIAREGLPIGSFLGWQMVGVNTETGLIDFAKQDGTVGPPSDPLDRVIIGNPNPDFFGGITNTFFYKGFDLSIMGQFIYGNEVFNYNLFTLYSGSNDTSNGGEDWTRRWRNPGDVTDVPRPTPGQFDNATISSRFVEDGSFFRLRNITLGYTLPETVLERLKVKSLRIYATVQNAFIFTNYSGYDPEVSSSIGGTNPGLEYGFDYGSYPQPRIITGGINLTF